MAERMSRTHSSSLSKLGLEGIVSKRRGMAYESGRSRRWLKTVKSERSGQAAAARGGLERWRTKETLSSSSTMPPIDNCGAGRRDASAGRSGGSHRPSRGPSDAEATLRKLLTIFDDETVVNRVALAPLIRNVRFQKKAPAGAGALEFTVTWGWSAHVERLLHVYQ